MPKNIKNSGKTFIAKSESSQAIKKAPKKKPQKREQTSEVSTEESEWMNLKYNAGFGNHFESEAREGALPKG